jgi:hypothetical protein
MCNDVQMSNFRRLWEDLIQYGHRLESFLVDKLEHAQVLLKAVVVCDGNIPEFEGVCVNVFESTGRMVGS